MLNPPMTREEAEATDFRYFGFQPLMCAMPCKIERHGADIASNIRQCGRVPGHGPDGLYCKQHAAMIAKQQEQTPC